MSRVLVDTGSEYTWLPETTLQKIGVTVEKKDLAFTMANGERITRSVGFAIIRIDKYFTIDEVVFGEPGDMTLLGARTLEGLSLVVDPRKKKLVAAGPLRAASAVHTGARVRFSISHFDAQIIAAAQRLDCALVYSEDLSHGQAYGAVRVMNPFSSET